MKLTQTQFSRILLSLLVLLFLQPPLMASDSETPPKDQRLTENPGRPDLMIRTVYLEGEQVRFVLSNNNDAPLPEAVWTTHGKEAPVVLVVVNGMIQSKVVINRIPNARNLDTKGLEIIFKSKVHVSTNKINKVTVSISDPKNILQDLQPNNNRVIRTFRQGE